MPPAIKFYSLYHNDSAYMLWFMTKLERLASYLLVTGRDVNHRMDRYKWLLVEMETRPVTSIGDLPAGVPCGRAETAGSV